MTYRHIFLTHEALRTIRAEVRDRPFTETGGALVGYHSKDQALVITGASGPGPRAQCTPWSVTLDGEYTTRFCNDVYESSNGKYDYIGDWHRHVWWSLSPSRGDHHAMERITNAQCCTVPQPVSLIYRRNPEALIMYVYNDGRLVPTSSSIIPTAPTR